MNIHVRKAAATDLPAMYNLVIQLAIYEKEPQAVTSTIADYKNHFENIFHGFVAINEEQQILGMALYYYAWSTWKGKMMYLEDFVVDEQHRRLGIGQLLFDAILQEAHDTSCALLKWEVLDWNEPALKFYKKNQAVIETQWWDGKIYMKSN